MNWSDKNAAEQPEPSRAREVRFIQVEDARKFQEEIQDRKEIQDVMKVETRSKTIYTRGQKNRSDDTSEEEGSIKEDSSSSDLKKKPSRKTEDPVKPTRKEEEMKSSSEVPKPSSVLANPDRIPTPPVVEKDKGEELPDVRREVCQHLEELQGEKLPQKKTLVVSKPFSPTVRRNLHYDIMRDIED
jgi:hypothetical protein